MTIDQTPERAELREQYNQYLEKHNTPDRTTKDVTLDFIQRYADRQERAARIETLNNLKSQGSYFTHDYSENEFRKLIDLNLAELHQTGRSGEGTNE